MAFERLADRLAARGVPNPRRLVRRRGDDTQAVGAERRAIHRTLMAQNDPLLERVSGAVELQLRLGDVRSINSRGGVGQSSRARAARRRRRRHARATRAPHRPGTATAWSAPGANWRSLATFALFAASSARTARSRSTKASRFAAVASKYCQIAAAATSRAATKPASATCVVRLRASAALRLCSGSFRRFPPLNFGCGLGLPLADVLLFARAKEFALERGQLRRLGGPGLRPLFRERDVGGGQEPAVSGLPTSSHSFASRR